MLQVERTVLRIVKRSELNSLAKKLGIRPSGEVKAKIAEIKALQAEVVGESPEIIEDLNNQAAGERRLDEQASRVLQADQN